MLDLLGPHNIFFRKKITNLNPVTPDLMLSELIHHGQSQRKPWISNNYLPRHCHWLGRPGLPTTGRGWPRNLCPGHTFVPCLLSPPRVSRTLGEYDLARCQQNKYKVHQDQGSEYSIACIGEGDQLTKEQVYPCCRTISSNPVTIHRVIRGRLGSPRQNVEQKKAGGGHLGATMKGGSSRKAPPHDPLPSTRRLSQTSLQQVFTLSNTSRHLCQKLMYL